MTTRRANTQQLQVQQQIPPFDYAQGRLFGDDNQKNKGNDYSYV
jgi:hypothetical protein